MPRPPSGNITFLFTDIAGSTKLWEEHPDAMNTALERHDALLRQAVEAHRGYVFKTVGDAFCASFSQPGSALEAAMAAQLALQAEPWQDIAPLRVRMALHTGQAQERDGDYFGPTLNQYEAVQLFIARAQAVQPSFQVTGQNAPAVLQICQQLDGIPLALELAAARVKVLSVQKLAERLNDRFHLLTGGSRTALPRQQTLKAAIDWSYDLLSEPEQALFQRLSVFRGGWTLEAAEAVCAGGVVAAADGLDLLAQLVQKSLVEMEERQGEPRYRLLETVRLYSQEKLEASGEAKAWRWRQAGFFLALAEQAEPELTGPQQQQWLERLRVRAGHQPAKPEPGAVPGAGGSARHVAGAKQPGQCGLGPG
ncbi:MAG: adenylate/guanylate cyclase domain-containing protein [Deinococcus sp.]|nr:adenylate/guanylate cyclase domain-containing protein [Deinococcus sp.]